MCSLTKVNLAPGVDELVAPMKAGVDLVAPMKAGVDLVAPIDSGVRLLAAATPPVAGEGRSSMVMSIITLRLLDDPVEDILRDKGVGTDGAGTDGAGAGAGVSGRLSMYRMISSIVPDGKEGISRSSTLSSKEEVYIDVF